MFGAFFVYKNPEFIFFLINVCEWFIEVNKLVLENEMLNESQFLNGLKR